MLGEEGAVMTTLDGVTKTQAEQRAAAELVRLAQEQACRWRVLVQCAVNGDVQHDGPPMRHAERC
jgi:hypothetical protein